MSAVRSPFPASTWTYGQLRIFPKAEWDKYGVVETLGICSPGWIVVRNVRLHNCNRCSFHHPWTSDKKVLCFDLRFARISNSKKNSRVPWLRLTQHFFEPLEPNNLFCLLLPKCFCSSVFKVNGLLIHSLQVLFTHLLTGKKRSRKWSWYAPAFCKG